MEKLVQWQPAWDKRSKDSGRNYGVHGMTLRFILKGPKGAAQFVIYTNWHLPHVQKEMEARGNAILLTPMAADLGWHSLVPQYEGQSVRQTCDILGHPCYHDGSILDADSLFAAFVELGEKAVWEKLAEIYSRLLGVEE